MYAKISSICCTGRLICKYNVYILLFLTVVLCWDHRDPFLNWTWFLFFCPGILNRVIFLYKWAQVSFGPGVSWIITRTRGRFQGPVWLLSLTPRFMTSHFCGSQQGVSLRARTSCQGSLCAFFCVVLLIDSTTAWAWQHVYAVHMYSFIILRVA